MAATVGRTSRVLQMMGGRGPADPRAPAPAWDAHSATRADPDTTPRAIVAASAGLRLVTFRK
jgi:hypothetical protein